MDAKFRTIRAGLAAVLACATLLLAPVPTPFAAQPATAPAKPSAAPPMTAAAAKPGTAAAQPMRGYDQIFGNPGFLAGDKGLTESEKVGRRIWMFATAGNSRFHTYVFQQRLGVLIDWYRVLGTGTRGERFATWGLINDPGCCTPGSDGCAARSRDETYGFDYCEGDGELLQYVGRDGYRDPACDLPDAPLAANEVHGPADQRESPCALDFGTSTGVLGLRKFPNPRFDAAKWRELNGSLASWQGYQERLDDGSIEPPFRIGMACGACHIAFNPLNPPKDPANPRWENIDALIGNQYGRFSELMASGMPASTLEWQIFSHARPGTVDTSAVPNDGVNNPGTMNAIINFGKRPLHQHDIIKWSKAKSCAVTDDTQCWCEPGREGKCWQRSQVTEMVPNILKGGEDSVGVVEAIQRVYINIGSCSEQAWVNHLVDLRQADPQQRLFHQTPFDIGQARRDCAAFRAVEDRLGDLASFLLTGRPFDLQRALKLPNDAALVAQLEGKRGFGAGAVGRGRQLFAANCARCHSSKDSRAVLVPAQTPLAPLESRDFRAVDPAHPDLRLDWMGSDELIPASRVGSYPARALHSNHMKGHVWQEYGSETLRARPADEGLPEADSLKDGGRGYYRAISLLSAWATAPFLHNNSIGPELCGPAPAANSSWSADPRRNFYRSPYVATSSDGKLLLDDSGNPQPLPNPPPCWAFDASVEGRFKLYQESMRQLLNPGERIPAITRLQQEVVIPIGPRYVLRAGAAETGFEIRVPAGTPSIAVANLHHKDLVGDLVVAATNPRNLDARLAGRWGQQEGAENATLVRDLLRDLRAQPGNAVTVLRAYRPAVQRFYSSSTAMVENEGHRFGEALSAQQKSDLTAFVATL